MTGTYPVYIGGERAGSLTVSREGLYTVFELDCRDPGELTRISVYGDREGYLGVLLPREGRATLRRRLSRRELELFPAQITMVCESGRSPHGEKAEGDAAELIWYRDPGGALVTTRGEQKLMAVPEEAGGIPAESILEHREIGGRRYAVLEVVNGHINPAPKREESAPS